MIFIFANNNACKDSKKLMHSNTMDNATKHETKQLYPKKFIPLFTKNYYK